MNHPLRDLIQPADFVGRLCHLDFASALVLTNDHWKDRCSLGANCLLLATALDPAQPPGADEEVLLLRVRGTTDLPDSELLLKARIDFEQQQRAVAGAAAIAASDQLTAHQMQFHGLDCRVLGTFYERDGARWLGSDLESFRHAARLNVYRPTGAALAAVVNQVDPQLLRRAAEQARQQGLTEPLPRFRIGTVRYASTQHRRAAEPPVVVTLDPNSFLNRRTAVLGATGCGKPSLINEILWQLIHHAAGDPRHKLGLLILAPKGDESVQKVRDYATAAGRANDVIALDGVAPVHYNFFAGLRELRDVDGFARRLLFAASPMSRENAFWDDLRRNLLVAALTVLVSTSERPTFTEAVSFLSGWLMGPGAATPPVALRLTQFSQVLAAAAVLTPAERLQLQTTQDQVSYWRDLDSRMRGSAQATLLNVLQPLVSARAADYLSERGPTVFDAARAVREGKLLVASVNALTEPALAALLFRLLKLKFYAAIQSRGVFSPAGHRLAGLLVDEAQLCLGDGDVEQLATLRSKGGFVVAATQGLSALGELLGPSRRDALLLNFNTTFFFQTSEAETEVYRAAELRVARRAAPDPHRGHQRPRRRRGAARQARARVPAGHARAVAAAHVLRRAPRVYLPLRRLAGPALLRSAGGGPGPVVPPSLRRSAGRRAGRAGGGEPGPGRAVQHRGGAHPPAHAGRRCAAAGGRGVAGRGGARVHRRAEPAGRLGGTRDILPHPRAGDAVAGLGGDPARHLAPGRAGRAAPPPRPARGTAPLTPLPSWAASRGRLGVRFCHQVLAEEGNAEADEWTQRQEDQLRVQLQRAVYPSLYRPLKPCHYAGFWHHAPHLRTLLTEQR